MEDSSGFGDWCERKFAKRAVVGTLYADEDEMEGFATVNSGSWPGSTFVRYGQGHTYAAVKERITLSKIPHPNAKTAFFSSPYENSRLMIPFPRPGRRPGRGKIFSLP